jgi:hypothetical protein
MANAKIDGNGVKTTLGTLQSDGVTLVPMAINPANHGAKVVDATTGTNVASSTAKRDENHVPALMGVSSVDGTTLIPIAFDSAGNILIQSS